MTVKTHLVREFHAILTTMSDDSRMEYVENAVRTMDDDQIEAMFHAIQEDIDDCIEEMYGDSCNECTVLPEE